MKNKILLSIAILFCTISNAQDLPKIKLTHKGVEPIVVVVDKLNSSDLYKKALNWVQETYKNPENVIKAKIENEKIRINGFKENAWYFYYLGSKWQHGMEYSVEISFKDGKYKFDYQIGTFYEGTKKLDYDYTKFYKKSGEIRNNFSNAPEGVEDAMNNLSLSFYNYITDKTKLTKDNW
jgi:hypothetical protein